MVKSILIGALCAASFYGTASPAAAQSVSVADIVNGARFPATIKPGDLGPDYKAVKLKAQGESSYMDVFTGPMGMFMLMGTRSSAGGTEGAQFETLALLETSWTKGESVQIQAGEPFLVTYKPDLDLASLMALSTNPSAATQVSLKLHLVKLSSITSLAPSPEITKDKLLAALGNLSKVFAASGASSAVGAVQTASSEPMDADTMQSRRTTGLNNAKQVALGIIMYANDYDDVLPYVQATSTVQEVVYPYIKNASVWTSMNPRSRLLFNISVGGASMTAIDKPAEVPLICESEPWTDGQRIVAYCDGHVAVVDGGRWQEMAKLLKLKLKRTAKKPLPVHLQTSLGATPKAAGMVVR